MPSLPQGALPQIGATGPVGPPQGMFPRQDGFGPSGPRGPANADLARVIANIAEIEACIVAQVQSQLNARPITPTNDTDDEIFESFTEFVDTCRRSEISDRGISLWESKISQIVESKEKEIRNIDPAARIHKGAPYYNVGLLHFVNGNFDDAFRYFVQSGEEDKLSGKETVWRDLAKPLSRQILVDPIWSYLSKYPVIQKDYQRCTGQPLYDDELLRLLQWLLEDSATGLHAILTLHRLRRADDGFQNLGAKHQRARAVADLAVTVETSYRRWQRHLPSGALNERQKDAFTPTTSTQPNSRIIAKYKECEEQWSKLFGGKPNKESFEGVDWGVSYCISGLENSQSSAESAGLASFLALRVRNSVLHQVDDKVVLYNDKDVAIRVAGVLLATLRVSKHGADGTLNRLT